MKFYKISWVKYEKDCLNLAKKVMSSPAGGQIKKIVAISRGGLVAARILSDLLSLPISHIAIASYQNLKQEKEPVITETPNHIFADEKILIVDEVCDTGKTFKRAIKYFKHFTNCQIYTLSLYLKPKSKYVPHYWTEKTDRWIIFPYEVRETHNAFLKIFKSPQKAREQMIKVGFERWELNNVKS